MILSKSIKIILKFFFTINLKTEFSPKALLLSISQNSSLRSPEIVNDIMGCLLLIKSFLDKAYLGKKPVVRNLLFELKFFFFQKSKL